MIKKLQQYLSLKIPKVCEEPLYVILLGPSLADRHNSNWNLGMERDMIPKDVMEKYEKGEDIFYDTAYGKGYITKKGHQLIKKYAINLDEPIEVHKPLLQHYRNSYSEWKKINVWE